MKAAPNAAPVTAAFALTLACPASACPSPTTAVQLAHMCLGDGFTLIYQATARDLRPAFLRPALLREKQTVEAKKATSEALAAGKGTRMQKNMADNYSSWGASDRKTGTESAILLDGDIEYEVNGKVPATISNDGWRTALIYGGGGERRPTRLVPVD